MCHPSGHACILLHGARIDYGGSIIRGQQSSGSWHVGLFSAAGSDIWRPCLTGLPMLARAPARLESISSNLTAPGLVPRAALSLSLRPTLV